MEKALIYAREIDGPWLVRGSGSHRGMAAAARRNVRVVVERAYHEVIGGP